MVVLGGGNQPAATALERRRLAPPSTLGLVPHMELSGLGVGGVEGRQPIDLVGGHVEAGVLHFQRIEDAFAQERLE